MFHILADRNRLLPDISHRSRAFFHGETLPFGAGDAFGGKLSGFLLGHLLIQISNEKSPRSIAGLSGLYHHFSTSVNGARCSSKRQVFRASFAPHLVGLDLEVDLLAFGEA